MVLSPQGPLYSYSAGDSIDIECEVECNCIGAMATWNNEGDQFVPGLQYEQELHRASLVALNATTEMSGTYTCTAHANNNTYMYNSQPHTQTITITIEQL